MNADRSEHGCIPGCYAQSLAEAYPDEQKPDHLSDYSWNEVLMVHHEEGCPNLKRSIERGLELAERFGWK